MTSFRKFALAMIAGASLAVASSAVSAATVVKVDLWDRGADVTMNTTLAYTGAKLDKSKATMGITATPTSVPAGEISFEVTNTSKDTVHEMIVMYLADPAKALPYIEGDAKVDEDKAGDKGEVSELDPGKSGVLTVELKPGKHLLICNVVGHFAAGMWTEFEVT